MRAAAAEWVGVFLAVQWCGGGRAISEALLIGPEKKKREISIRSMTVQTMRDGMAGGRCVRRIPSGRHPVSVRRVYVEPIW